MSHYVAQHRVVYGQGALDKPERATAEEGDQLHPAAHPDDIALLLKLGAIRSNDVPAPRKQETKAKE